MSGPPIPAARILFVIMAPDDWSDLRSVWAACGNRSGVVARVVLAPSGHTDRASRLYPAARAAMIAEDVPFTLASDGLLDAFRPDVVFLPRCDLEELPPSLAERELTARGIRIAHVAGDVELRGGGFRTQRQFNQRLHRRAWRIFARSDAQRRMFGRYCAAGSGHVAVTGSPSLDAVAPTPRAQAAATALRARIGGRRAVLWTPRFESHPDMARSSFEQASGPILDLFDRLAATHALILRPDPLLLLYLRASGRWSGEQEAEFLRRVLASEHVFLDEAPDRSPAMEVAEAMIFESGLAPPVLLARGAPVIYLQTEGALGLDSDEPLTAQVTVCRHWDAFARAVETLAGETGGQSDAGAADPTAPGAGESTVAHIVEALRAGDEAPAVEPDADARHARARAYWQRSVNTYLAPPTYYDRQEQLFEGLLGRWGRWANALDVGCGDGRYTLMLGAHADRVTGCDISANLVEQAAAKAAAQGLRNVGFRVEPLDAVRTLGRYDLVCCCGVLSGFLDIRAYAQAISLLRAMVEPGGLLVTKESVSLGQERVGDDPASGYVASYRNRADYIDSFTTQGFELVETATISTRPEVEGAFFVFRRR